MKNNAFHLLFSVIFLLVQTHSKAQENVEIVQWKGFEKEFFTFQGRKAWYVKPAHAKEGNPWVWRAHFPDWHTDMDSILLTRGFHIAYVNTNDLYGHPRAMQVWDAFYDYLVKTKNFAPKVALEGVSRGGLYVYGWAKRNPDKVSCIYAEAPVCDPKSWPGGKEKNNSSKKDWEAWLALYGLTEEEAAHFTDIPLNNLEGLAAFKVPVMHVVGLKDELVPPAENSDLLIRNYLQAGGPASVYPMTRGEQTLQGHHFPIEHPQIFAGFVEQHSLPVRKLLSHEPYIQSNAGLGNAFEKFRKQKKGTVAFLGGSITYNPGWRNKTMQYLQEHFPDTEFTFIAAGISSLGSTPHAFRFGKDVLEKGIPDLLFLEAAVNDRVNGFSEKAQIRGMEGILRQLYTANPNANAVVMALADPDKNAMFAAEKMPDEVAVHERVARYYGAAFINLARETFDRIGAGEFSWQYDFKDLHPSSFGQEVYAQTIKELLKKETAAQSVAKLPAPLDQFSYSGGHYENVQKATKLKGFNQVENWNAADKVGTREGFVNVPMLVGEAAGQSFELDFTGRAVGIAIISGPDAGIISYTIDGRNPRQRDLFTEWSPQLHLPWYVMLDDELSPGRHKLRLTIEKVRNKKSKGNACRVVHFLVSE